ncbi:MAG: hypothetical protein AAFX94_00285 [Myxococcota bacterium]
MTSLWLALFAFVLPGDGPVNRKQLRKALRELKSCVASATPTPSGASLAGGRQYAEVMRMEMRGIESKPWSPGAGQRTFSFEKKAAFGQRFRFQVTVGTEELKWVRVRLGNRGDKGAYGALWRGNRIVYFPMEERCAESRCSWERTREIEMTCSAAAMPAAK